MECDGEVPQTELTSHESSNTTENKSAMDSSVAHNIHGAPDTAHGKVATAGIQPSCKVNMPAFDILTLDEDYFLQGYLDSCASFRIALSPTLDEFGALVPKIALHVPLPATHGKLLGAIETALGGGDVLAAKTLHSVAVDGSEKYGWDVSAACQAPLLGSTTDTKA